MPDEHHTPTNGVPPVSERVRNEPTFGSERFGNVRKEDDVSFGKAPDASERNNPPFPNASESFRSNPPSASETIDEIMSRPERKAEHKLTAREVEKLFEQAGRPVTERSILNWCKPNSEGVCRLNCGYERGERRWYIAPDSVERVIAEERKKDQPFPNDSWEFSEARERLSETFGNEPTFGSESFGNVRKENDVPFGKLPHASERVGDIFPNVSESTAPHRASTSPGEPASGAHEAERMEAEAAQKIKLDDLQNRIIELEREAAAGQYKDELITRLREQLNEDRQDYNGRMKFYEQQIEKLQTTSERYVEELVGVNRRVGQLEAENRTLRMLPAGNRQTRNIYHESEPEREEPHSDASEATYDPRGHP